MAPDPALMGRGVQIKANASWGLASKASGNVTFLVLKWSEILWCNTWKSRAKFSAVGLMFRGPHI